MRFYYSQCEQCGASLRGKPLGAKFCSHACARSRHNTRMLRGARLHDMLVEWRRSYKNRHMLTDIGREVAKWIEEDARRAEAVGEGAGRDAGHAGQ